ncbi:uncharacterized protein DUF4913 [Streptomyces sp. 846.5]|nr:DUF4913 domain-containing protein [Streptomyces sp. 846.5]TDT93352.1 uncharacterized protein DUF4913 [Streptomyces sp. 846.5]
MSEPTVESLAEDIADLQAEREGFAAELELQKKLLDTLRENARDTAAPGSGEDSDASAGRGKASSRKGGKEEKPAGPPFILRLQDEVYTAELGALAHWVAEVLVPTYLREPASPAPWCPKWWEHPEAVARLHGLWLAWQELTDPATGGRTGPGVWHRDYLDPCIAQLRDPQGPFSACMVTDNKQQHRLIPPPPLADSPFPPPAEATAGGGTAP